MRLRNRTLPQAGTGANRNGESRPGPSSPGCPSYSGEGTVSHQTAQFQTAAVEQPNAANNNNHPYTQNSSKSSSPISSTYSLFRTPSSSPPSYQFEISLPPKSTSVSPLSCDVAQEALALFPLPISDTTSPTHTLQINSTNRVENNTQLTQAIINTPTRSVLQDMLPATTLAGKSRQRMKWTHDINTELLRCYYTVTLCETDLTAYRPLLRQEFLKIFPELNHLTEQRLSDQIRVIHKNNRLTPHERELIKQTVCSLNTNIDNSHNTNTTESIYTINESAHTSNNYTQSISEYSAQIGNQQSIQTNNNRNTASQPTRTDTRIECQTQEIETFNDIIDYNKIEDTFTEMLIKYSGIDATLRPSIPKINTTNKIIKTVNTVNNIIEQHLKYKERITIEEIHEVIYCAAVTVVTIHPRPEHKVNINKTGDKNDRPNPKDKKPQWEKRIENKITELRKQIGLLTQYLNGNLTRKKQQKINPHHKNKDEIIDQLDSYKQKLQAFSKRLRRYKISNKRKSDNNLFRNNQKAFYQKLNTDNINITQPPNIAEIQNYWESIWSKPTQHNRHSMWTTLEQNATRNINPMSEMNIDTEDVTIAVKKTLNWKAPGPDKIQNYWIKYFTSTHRYIADAVNHIINNPQDMPLYFTQGVTYLKPKDNDTTNPAKYRPITCLPTIYKLLTSIITHKLNSHIEQNKIIPDEQKGCSKGSRGCKEQLIIDTEIHNQVKKKNRNLYYAYIDYQKAFDSIPHSWLVYVLKMYKVDTKLINFLQYTMTKWKTRLNLKTDKSTFSTPLIKIARGIFQGDSLSPLWFCLAINPLTTILNNTNFGYLIDKKNNIKLTHLLYVDDIKIYAANRPQLDHLLKLTEKFSSDIKMSFGINKCKINSIIKGQYNKTNPFNLEIQEGVIDKMEPKETYKYLGYLQSTYINHTEIKNTLKTKYKQRLNKILNTQLSAINKVKAINTYAVPILTYSFGVIKWSDTELEALNTITRTASNKHNIHHIHSAVQRFTLKRKQGGRGFIDIKNLHYTQIDNLRKYFFEKSNNSVLHNSIVNLDHSDTILQLNNRQFDIQAKILNDDMKIKNWKKKALHGKYPHQLEQEHIDRSASCTWLTKGNIFGETEGFLIAIQDQVIRTRNYSKYILKETIESDKCRLCHQSTETIDHITGSCSVLANKEYIHRHDNVAKHIHQQLALKHKLLDTYTPYYKYRPKNVIENNEAKLYWNRDIITDRTVLSNRPDITLTIKPTKTTYLIDVAVPNTHNLKQKHTEKVQKYIPLADEIRQMWRQETVRIIPIIISSTGVIPKTLKAALKLIDLPENTYIPLQKSIVIDTCSIVRRFLNPTTLTIEYSNNTNATTSAQNTSSETHSTQNTRQTTQCTSPNRAHTHN